jgi:hypothetical protein
MMLGLLMVVLGKVGARVGPKCPERVDPPWSELTACCAVAHSL